MPARHALHDADDDLGEALYGAQHGHGGTEHGGEKKRDHRIDHLRSHIRKKTDPAETFDFLGQSFSSLGIAV